LSGAISSDGNTEYSNNNTISYINDNFNTNKLVMVIIIILYIQRTLSYLRLLKVTLIRYP